MNFLAQFLIAVAIDVISYVLQPKPKTSSTSSVQEADTPSADAGIPMGVVFYRKTIKAPNTIAWFDKSTNQYQVKV